MKLVSILVLISTALTISACALTLGSAATPESSIGMPNPAAQYCVDQGGKLENRDKAGGQAGYCLFPDGSECEEWAFFRDECAPGGGYRPLDSADCADLADAVSEVVGMDVVTDTAAFEDYVKAESGNGCRATATGTGEDFESYTSVADALKEMLQERGWEEDIQYAADGPTGTAAGFDQANRLCLLNVGWEPSEDADCPSDKPISACELPPEQQQYTIGINCAQTDADAAATAGGVIQSGDGYRFDQNGWHYVHIEGEPHERGYQHGYLLASELDEIFHNFKDLTYWNTGKQWEFFVAQAVEQFTERIDPEYLDEIKGIADGAQAAGIDISWQDVLTWNGYEELLGYWWPNEMAGKYAQTDGDHCSAFIATGSATKDGGIVMAHNSWDAFVHGQYFNVILDIEPAQGNRMFMQSAPGFIGSFTDFFVTDAGIMGTETTIGGYSEYDPDEDPEFFRIRKAMQYADDLDEFVALMEKKNNGGYANSWLLADTNTGEIMRFELGLQYQNVERTKDGYFVGYNAPVDPRIRNLETSGAGYDDIRTPAGARRVRLTQLMQEHHGEIDAEVAKDILADHYDVYLQKENPGSRTVEGRYDLDAFEYWPARLPFAPQGAVDGKVMDSDMASDLGFWARWGSSSGMPFDADEHLNQHPQWDHLADYLNDRPTEPWTFFTAGEDSP